MSEKLYSVEKIKDYFKGKFSRNFISRLVREMYRNDEVVWHRYRGLEEEGARKVIKRLQEIGSNIGKNQGYYNNGYKYVKTPEDSFSKPKKGYIAEHRYVMEQKLGRKLERNEFVYHINGRKDDNRPDNLIVCEGLKELREVRNSVVDLVSEMWQAGVLGFDPETKKYGFRDELLSE
jgi:hypothetical protein